MSVKLAIQALWHRRQLERSCGWTRARLEAHQNKAPLVKSVISEKVVAGHA